MPLIAVNIFKYLLGEAKIQIFLIIKGYYPFSTIDDDNVLYRIKTKAWLAWWSTQLINVYFILGFIPIDIKYGVE